MELYHLLVETVVNALIDRLETEFVSMELGSYCTSINVTIQLNKKGTKALGVESLNFSVDGFKDES